MTPKTALYQLKNNTQQFLSKNPVVCAGGSTSGQRPFSFGIHGSYQGPRANVNEVFTFTTIPLNTPNPEKPICENVRMIANSEVCDLTNLEAYTLGAGLDLMITGQLSGCAFCILNHGNNLTLAHVQPGGLRNMDGAQLRNTLINTGRFAGHAAHPLTAVYGMGDYMARAYVIGIKRAGSWELWGQAVSSGGANADIQAVTRIV